MPILLGAPYVPAHDENRMNSEGNLVEARERFLTERFTNLDVLLDQRFSWMNEHINEGDLVVEFGCGAGFSPLYVKKGNLTLTDVNQNEWVDKIADAMNPPFEPNSVDVIICSHMVHHMAKPVTFFHLVHKILKPEGRIIIQDLNTALTMRVLLKMMRHEGWSYDIDVFDENEVTNDPDDPWSANCAIPELLFKSSAEFEKKVPGYKIEKNELNECLLFPLSGGVIAKTPVPKLPRFMLKFIGFTDKILIALMPGIFAMGRSVVLKKEPISS
ncbi:class I SAM-dependent methyltransferase [Hirschia baltica]|uniref:Methyltransferase type 11 n=1 Tax=Hirschia baltica (strain ATCC 49814 / DSM 5838 / IFAM 1418) TaxID=582402 RepID=C6XS37_HIRBI|nr:class I SAM-dependent methyltransferase [Hirschia baltica]ACT60878.1 Methyltransferase type 11 [Hirschia baltica ATCC 49814]